MFCFGGFSKSCASKSSADTALSKRDADCFDSTSSMATIVPDFCVSACYVSSWSPLCDIDNLIMSSFSLNPTVFPAASLLLLYTRLELKWDPMRPCLPVLKFLIVLFFCSVGGYNSSIDMLDIYLKSSLVLVIERPKYAARAEAATKLPPFLSSLLSSCGDSKSDLNFRIFSSLCLTFRSPVISISYCFCLSICSSLCNFYSSSSF